MIQMPFRRSKNSQQNVPPEVAEYYQAEKKQRLGMAWLLSAATFVVTVLVVLGLFFGGRWIYRQVKHDNNTGTSISQEEPKSDQTNESQKAADTNASQNQSTTQNNPSGSVGQSTAPAPASNTPAPSATPNPSNAAASSQSTAATTVPNTGAGDLLALFMGVVVVAAIVHHLYLRRNIAE